MENNSSVWWANLSTEEKTECVNRFIKPGKDLKTITNSEVKKIYSYIEEEE